MKPAHSRQRGAFTLVEVLLATVLAAMLLVALWSMLSMYSKVFEGGHARTEQSQLARTLFDQIATDLQAVRQAPPAAHAVDPFSTTAGDAVPGSASLSASSSSSPVASPPPTTSRAPLSPPTAPVATTAAAPASSAQTASVPTGSDFPTPLTATEAAEPLTIATESLRPAGLFGTDSFLQIDVLQPAMLKPVREFDDTAEPGAMPDSPAAELKTIVYSFEESRELVAPINEPIMHLLRRELDWEQAHPGERGGGAMAGVSPLATGRPETLAEAPVELDASDDEPGLEDEQTTIVPEVLHFAMRYFDGTTWSDEWDSIARQGLPIAIEVTMQLRSYEEPDAVSEDAPLKSGVDYEKVMQWRHPTHRLLIPLAAAQRKPALENPSFGESRYGAEQPLGASTNVGPGQQ